MRASTWSVSPPNIQGRFRTLASRFRSSRSVEYSPRTFTSDLIAGVTVGLVALPLAMAFAISSGMSPQAGIYCAVVTGFLISALGGSNVQIGGPTGAFVVVVSGIIAQHGVDGLFMCTMMAGVLLVVMGLTGTGTAVRFIPQTGGDGIHQRHRPRHREHADQGPVRDRDRRRSAGGVRGRG